MNNIGVINAFLIENPTASFAIGMVLITLLLRYLASFFRNDTRSDKIDRASDQLMKSLQSTVERLGNRCDLYEGERNKLVRETAEMRADLIVLKDRVQRLDTERAALHAENVELKADNARKQEEIANLRAEVASLKDKVADLQLQVNGKLSKKSTS